MKITKAYKFEIDQRYGDMAMVHRICGSLRLLSNMALFERESAYQALLKHGVLPNKFLKVKWSKVEQKRVNEINSAYKVDYFTQQSDFKNTKCEEGLEFFKEIPADSAQQKLMDLDKAYNDFLDGKKGKPKVKRKSDKSDSIRFPTIKPYHVNWCKRVKVNSKGVAKTKGWGYIQLPKVGVLRFKQTYLIDTSKIEINNATLTQRGDRWFISINVDEEINLPRAKSGKILAIDRNANQDATLALSNGELLNGPKKLKEIDERIKVLQRSMKRMKKTSNRSKRIYERINKLHSKKANILRDWQHKATLMIAKNHSIISVETLQILGMTSSARGTVDEPGKNVAAKSGLNREMRRWGHGEILRQICYKVGWRNGLVYGVRPHYTSKTCSECGERKNIMRKRQDFECLSCDSSMHADLNAARNIAMKLEKYLTGRDTSEHVELLASPDLVVSKPRSGSMNPKDKKPKAS